MFRAMADKNNRATSSEITDEVHSNMQDPLARVEGVGSLQVFGAEYLQAADALHARQRVLHIAVHFVRDLRACCAVVFVCHRSEHPRAPLRFTPRYAGLLDFARPPR
ncbi:hypothetical protein CPI17_31060, partial [Klebsiella pneumoniae subsp. pneumoniae]|uniref:hypothetical protein n=1 Tax=Klebsiella pneumoniae TaxID=573 RepID=UPI0015E45394|nr:hypothetical protein [Klebsiella pneumoniae subsp. pneumoniae]